jgi:hypothetical protein
MESPLENKETAIFNPMLEKMGGERICQICGYIESEVYRLFCPHCMQRDRLSALTTIDRAHEIVSHPVETKSLPTHPTGTISMP